MKSLKKIMALVIATVMVLGMSTMAIADTETLKDNGNFSVTITANSSEHAETTAHSYRAYQIFKGDLIEKDAATTANTGANLTLSNIEFGNGVNGPQLIADLVAASGTTGNVLFGLFPNTIDSAAKLADAMDGITDDSAIAQAIAEIVQNNLTTNVSGTGSSTGVTGLNAGYYFIQDEGDLTEQEAATRYILQVVHSVEVAQKASVPEIHKYVGDKEDSVGTATAVDQTDADYDIGDAVPFKIEATLPSTFADYDTYKTYTITDTLCAGLTAPATTAISIKVGETDVSGHFDINITGTDKTEQLITISLKSGEDLKTWTNPQLTSSSKFVVEYSAILNDAANIGATGNQNKVKLTFSNNPNYDGDGDFGETPEEYVIVFTYKVVANKVDENNDALPGAGFTLFKKYKNSVDIPTGKTAVTTTTYNEGRSTYTFPTGEWSWAEFQKIDATTNGTTFSFDRIDEGDYVLVEHTTPAGYNSIEPIAFSVTPSHSGKALVSLNGQTASGTVKLGTLDATANKDAGSLTTDVQNKSGAVLPSTGGMGTTIFYVIGAILVLGAGILLVSKRRMSAN